MYPRARTIKPWNPRHWHLIKQLHSIPIQTPQTHVHSIINANIAISCHAKNGHLDIARKLFDQMPKRTVVSWNTMISGYAKWGVYNDVFDLFSEMHKGTMGLNETTCLTVLSVCSRLELVVCGEQVHCLVLKYGIDGFELVGSALVHFYACCFKICAARRVFDGLREWNSLVWSSIVAGYVKWGLLDDAFGLFMRMPSRDVAVWTSLISGYSKCEEGPKRALQLFRMMMESDEVRPNEFTLDCVLRACARLGVLPEGKSAHGLVIKLGFEVEQHIADALIGLYSCCNAVQEGRRINDGLLPPCTNASNTLIQGYLFSGNIEDAEVVYKSIIDKNPVSYNLMIKGYAMGGRVDSSIELFKTMPCRTIASTNTMISVYSESGEIDNALKLFEEAKGERNPVTWNSMISAYSENDQHEEGIKLYMTMHRISIECTRSTFSVLFHACSCLGSLQNGRLIHGHLIKMPLQSNVYVGTSLVDMYAKCGSISDAETAFDCITSPNVAAWTALIHGRAQNGLGCQAVVLFEQMLKNCVDPNGATFVGILSACGRAGMVDEGMNIFHSMELCCGVTPAAEHYACVVDLLGRSGHLQEAKEFISQMPIEADAVIWSALLKACCFWMDFDVGERVAEKMFSFDSTSAYVIMSNMNARLGNWDEKTRIRRSMMDLDVKKKPGCSWIELKDLVHVFSTAEKAHPCSSLIYQILENLMRNINLAVQPGNNFVTLCFDC
ncbi:hypothetical protein Drorol1_Dr00009454 [Drosera rotundifolia]